MCQPILTFSVRELDCASEGSTCELKAESNYGLCYKPRSECTAKAAGELTYCDVERTIDGDTVVGAASYVTYFDCVPNTEGEFVAFLSESLKTETCEKGCFNAYQCAEVQDGAACEKNYCTGDVLTYCPGDGTSYSMDCKYQYGIGCVTTEEGADCDWDNFSIE